MSRNWKEEKKESLLKQLSQAEDSQAKIEKQLEKIIGKELNALEFLKVRQLVEDYERNDKQIYTLNDQYNYLA